MTYKIVQADYVEYYMEKCTILFGRTLVAFISTDLMTFSFGRM